MKKLREYKKLIIWILAVLFVCCVTVWVYIHRRVIRAAVKGEPMPACPHWLPEALRNKCGF